MENFEPTKYRNNLARSLERKRELGDEGKELAKEQLGLEKDTIDYARAEIQHREDNLKKKAYEVKMKEDDERHSKITEGLLEKLSFVQPDIECGQVLGRMSWREAQEALADFNLHNTDENEKPWRMPTPAEITKAINDKRKFGDDLDSLYILEKCWSGFECGSKEAYTTSSTNVHLGSEFGYTDKDDRCLVFLVR